MIKKSTSILLTGLCFLTSIHLLASSDIKKVSRKQHPSYNRLRELEREAAQSDQGPSSADQVRFVVVNSTLDRYLPLDADPNMNSSLDEWERIISLAYSIVNAHVIPLRQWQARIIAQKLLTHHTKKSAEIMSLQLLHFHLVRRMDFLEEENVALQAKAQRNSECLAKDSVDLARIMKRYWEIEKTEKIASSADLKEFLKREKALMFQQKEAVEKQIASLTELQNQISQASRTKSELQVDLEKQRQEVHTALRSLQNSLAQICEALARIGMKFGVVSPSLMLTCVDQWKIIKKVYGEQEYEKFDETPFFSDLKVEENPTISPALAVAAVKAIYELLPPFEHSYTSASIASSSGSSAARRQLDPIDRAIEMSLCEEKPSKDDLVALFCELGQHQDSLIHPKKRFLTNDMKAQISLVMKCLHNARFDLAVFWAEKLLEEPNDTKDRQEFLSCISVLEAVAARESLILQHSWAKKSELEGFAQMIALSSNYLTEIMQQITEREKFWTGQVRWAENHSKDITMSAPAVSSKSHGRASSSASATDAFSFLRAEEDILTALQRCADETKRHLEMAQKFSTASRTVAGDARSSVASSAAGDELVLASAKKNDFGELHLLLEDALVQHTTYKMPNSAPQTLEALENEYAQLKQKSYGNAEQLVLQLQKQQAELASLLENRKCFVFFLQEKAQVYKVQHKKAHEKNVQALALKALLRSWFQQELTQREHLFISKYQNKHKK